MKTGTILFIGLLMAGLGGAVSYWIYSPSNSSAPRPLKETGKDGDASVVGMPRPQFALRDTDGVMHEVSEWDGKILVLNFWATWCPPCREEIPEFVHLQEKYADRSVRFVGIAPEEAGPVRDFAAEFDINYPLLVGQGDVIRVAEEYGNTVGALPYTVIVDRQGRIAYTQRGPLPKPKAESHIRSLLQEGSGKLSNQR